MFYSRLFTILIFVVIIGACGDDEATTQTESKAPAVAVTQEADQPQGSPANSAVQSQEDTKSEPSTEITNPVAEGITEKADEITEQPTDSATTVPETTTKSPASSSGSAQTHTINAEARVFNPEIVYIQLGDTVQWKNMTSHNSVTYVVPDGAAGWGEHGKLPGGSFSATPDKEGVYGYACEPHVGFGMVGVVVVGTPTQAMVDAAMTKADAELQGPFRRIIGKINKIVIP